METLEQINERFLKVASEINEYMKYVEMQERCLKQSLSEVDLKCLSESKEYLKEHEFAIKEKIEWAQKEWETLCRSRTFHYEELGKFIASLLTKKEGIPYFCATRLVKHVFQVDEVNRPFYRVVSFVTANPNDLNRMLMERITSTMHVYYFNNSPVMKPLSRELQSMDEYERMVGRELELRDANNAYVITRNTISSFVPFETPENQSLMKSFAFSYVNDALERLIERRFHEKAKELPEKVVVGIVEEFCNNQKQVSNVVI